MTQDEIIEMAKQADCLHVNLTGDRAKALERLEAFAKLVDAKATAKEREVILDMVAFYGGPVDLVDAIRARGEITSKGEA